MAGILIQALTGLAASLAAAQAAPSAQGANADEPQEITVTGRREAITKTLKEVLNTSDSGQIGRFEDRFCPGVAGLPENYAVTIVEIVRRNAEAAGLTLNPEGCRPNAVAVFVSDPPALVNGWLKRDPSLFGTMEKKDVAALTRRPYPIVSWRVTETRAWDGTQAERASSMEGSPAGGKKGIMIVRNALASRSRENIREDILLSLAVVDTKAIKGKSLQQLADIATLHLLLDVAPDAGEKASSNSILSLFAKRPAGQPLPAQLSEFDRGLLRGLYKAPENNLSGSMQRSRMVREIRRETGEKR